MKRYLMLLGTRPEAIKLCPLILELRRRTDVQLRVVLTGQHRDMPAPVLTFFGVCPDADLGVMTQGQTLQSLSERLLTAISRDMQISGFAPDAILVHGDTTTAFIGALCAFYAGIPVVHIEAGLRTGDISAPFPEEFNRRAIDAMSRIHFAPTAQAKTRLMAEGHKETRVFVVGNTATDALRLCLERPCEHPLLDMVGERRLILLTAHRRETAPEQRLALFRAIREELEGRRDTVAIFPVHPSPVIREAAEATFVGCDNVKLTDPLDVPIMQHLLARTTLLLTDSGGLQEEATYLGVPTLVLREMTERPEGVAAGVLRLVGTDGRGVRAALSELLENEQARRHMARPSDAYGDGYVSVRIAAILAALAEASEL
ncbi:MAG: UDP-N-acetylglucosamine 2-epimerase (non-hydrolyzing) [Clostridia bacterium]|nr:UDP-N-acetylglucosamine 2-epimerase (non-hydrolyzing) [Clostridia bacterium]